MFRAWKEHAERRIVRLEEVGFDPGESDPRITCNLWGGWPSAAKAGKCDLLLDLLAYMCGNESNSRALYEWVLRWVAYPIQHPGAKMKTTVVVHGPQGTGKNLFFESVMAIYGKYGRILDQDALVDKHNDWASRKLFLIADEVVAQAHRFEVKNKLKTLITGNWIRINPKHVAAYDEANHVNLVFLSNEQMPVVLEEDDRRHCVIWTPDKKPADFYAKLLAEIADGGIAALHDHLLHLDLGDFHPGTPPPSTSAKQDLVDLAQDSPVDFVDALFYGDLEPLKAMPGLTSEWYAVYQRWCARCGVKAASMKRFVNTLDRRRQFRTARKGYLDVTTITHPRSMLLFRFEPPEGMVESTWLGEQVTAMRNRRDDYMNADLRGGRREADG
jgi:putative DNA primase/helicase